MDAGIIFKDDRPLSILTAYTEHVPAALPDGTPGFAAAAQLIGRMARLCYDNLEALVSAGRWPRHHRAGAAPTRLASALRTAWSNSSIVNGFWRKDAPGPSRPSRLATVSG